MSSLAPRRSWEGRVVAGKFPLRQWLGGSDHSFVFLTERPGSSKKAAIKLIPANTVDPEQQLDRWRSGARLSHPNLIRLFDVGRCEFDNMPLLYLVMEYAEEDLSQILPERPLTPAEVGDFLPATLDVLSYLHGRGLVHSAIKPANIQAVGNQLKISADCLRGADQSSIKAGPLTVYDAPESASGTVTPAADLWSIGITIVEALTQHPPRHEGTLEPAVPDTVPPPFRDIARACLRRDPKQRCSIADFRTRLGAMAVPASVSPRPSEKKRLRRWILAPVAVALVAAAVLVRQKVLMHRDGVDSSQTAQKATQPATPKSLPAEQSQQSKPMATRTGSGGQVLNQVLPEVPKSARNTIQGRIRVIVRVDVDSSGKVTAATPTSPGPSQYFARLALKAAQQWEFDPPVVKGQKVPSAWNIRFMFARGATQAFPSKTASR